MPALQGWGGRPWYQEVAKTSNYSLLLSDSGTLFTTTGAGGAVTFTLPALVSGFSFCAWFYNTVIQNMIITAPTNKLVTLGNSSATSGCYTTAADKCPAFCFVTMNDLGTFYYLMSMSGTITSA